MAEIEVPRLQEFGPMLITGLGQRYNDERIVGIPALRQRLANCQGSGLEIYSKSFNPARPGGVEIWIPVEE